MSIGYIIHVTMVTGIHCLYSVNGRVEDVSIYKRGHYYGSPNNEKYTSIEHCVADLSRTGLSLNEGTTLVTPGAHKRKERSAAIYPNVNSAARCARRLMMTFTISRARE